MLYIHEDGRDYLILQQLSEIGYIDHTMSPSFEEFIINYH